MIHNINIKTHIYIYTIYIIINNTLFILDYYHFIFIIYSHSKNYRSIFKYFEHMCVVVSMPKIIIADYYYYYYFQIDYSIRELLLHSPFIRFAHHSHFAFSAAIFTSFSIVRFSVSLFFDSSFRWFFENFPLRSVEVGVVRPLHRVYVKLVVSVFDFVLKIKKSMLELFSESSICIMIMK